MAIINKLPPDSFSFPVSSGSKPPTEWKPIGVLPEKTTLVSPLTFDGQNFVGIGLYKQSSYSQQFVFLKSADCETWTSLTTNLPTYPAYDSSCDFRAIAYGNGVYVTHKLIIEEDYDENYELVEYHRCYIYYSTDGISWSQSNFYSSNRTNTAQFVKDKFIVRFQDENYNYGLYYSTNGATWNVASTSYLPEIPVAVGDKLVDAQYSAVLTSTNGTAWTSTSLPTAVRFAKNHNAYANGVYFATYSTSSNNKAAFSNDGLNWTAITLAESGLWWCFGGGKWLIAIRQKAPGTAYYSQDGQNWEKITIATATLGLSFWSAYGNKRFVLDTDNGTYYSIC